MTREEFQRNHSGDLKTFLESPVGQRLLVVLGALRPPHNISQYEHILLDSYANRRGYEQCLSTLLGLCLPQNKPTEVEANYGITDQKDLIK